ncbi:hypothetical protein [Rhodococcus sp. NPDC006774]|uniref:hypothetical protein n=1 Tax=Rhodococcus sp. NPDC006774 TaxID=3157186 RepID=UPI0034040596
MFFVIASSVGCSSDEPAALRSVVEGTVDGDGVRVVGQSRCAVMDSGRKLIEAWSGESSSDADAVLYILTREDWADVKHFEYHLGGRDILVNLEVEPGAVSVTQDGGVYRFVGDVTGADGSAVPVDLDVTCETDE